MGRGGATRAPGSVSGHTARIRVPERTPIRSFARAFRERPRGARPPPRWRRSPTAPGQRRTTQSGLHDLPFLPLDRSRFHRVTIAEMAESIGGNPEHSHLPLSAAVFERVGQSGTRRADHLDRLRAGEEIGV